MRVKITSLFTFFNMTTTSFKYMEALSLFTFFNMTTASFKYMEAHVIFLPDNATSDVGGILGVMSPYI